MIPELIVAKKEFTDHITSKRFLAIFAILMLVSIVGMITSMDEFHKSLDNYKSILDFQQSGNFSQRMASLQQNLTDLENNGGSQQQIQQMQMTIRYYYNPPRPSILTVFGGQVYSSSSGVANYFPMIVVLLSMALGFDLITREKEEGSLKSLLSHPVYRDAVINGKLIGAMSSMAVAMGSVFLLTIAIMIVYGAVPTFDDLIRFGAYFVMALLYGGVFFALAAMFSAISKSSSMSILCVLAVVMAIIILPSVIPNIASTIVGSEPAPTITVSQASNSASSSINQTKTVMNPAYQQYYQTKYMLTDTMSTISADYDFSYRISPAILDKLSANTGSNVSALTVSSINTEPSLWDSLTYVSYNIIALIVEFAIFIAITYIIFMRLDVR